MLVYIAVIMRYRTGHLKSCSPSNDVNREAAQVVQCISKHFHVEADLVNDIEYVSDADFAK